MTLTLLMLLTPVWDLPVEIGSRCDIGVCSPGTPAPMFPQDPVLILKDKSRNLDAEELALRDNCEKVLKDKDAREAQVQDAMCRLCFHVQHESCATLLKDVARAEGDKYDERRVMALRGLALFDDIESGDLFVELLADREARVRGTCYELLKRMVDLELPYDWGYVEVEETKKQQAAMREWWKTHRSTAKGGFRDHLRDLTTKAVSRGKMDDRLAALGELAGTPVPGYLQVVRAVIKDPDISADDVYGCLKLAMKTREKEAIDLMIEIGLSPREVEIRVALHMKLVRLVGRRPTAEVGSTPEAFQRVFQEYQAWWEKNKNTVRPNWGVEDFE